MTAAATTDLERIATLHRVVRGETALIPTGTHDVAGWIRAETAWLCTYAEEFCDDYERDWRVLVGLLARTPARQLRYVRGLAELWRLLVGTSPSIPEWIVTYADRALAAHTGDTPD